MYFHILLVMCFRVYTLHVGIRLLSSTGATDAQMADALSYQNNIISVYSNSWGPLDNGRTVAGPDTVAAMAFQNDVAVVSLLNRNQIFIQLIRLYRNQR